MYLVYCGDECMFKLEDVDRSKKEGFLLYFLLRPAHFEEIFYEEATAENIEKQFKQLQERKIV